MRVLADVIIPADARSGSATDALVPEFIDFILDDPLAEVRERERLQTRDARRPRLARPRVRPALRQGLRWRPPPRSGGRFSTTSPGRRRPAPRWRPGVAFFTLFRDLVASGFWSSKMGVDDLRFMGNTFVAEWNGCPPEVLPRRRQGGD